MKNDTKKELAKAKALAKKLKKAEKEARVKAIKNRKPFKGLQIRPTVSLFDEKERQEPGENNREGFGFDIHPQVTIFSAILLAVFIIGTLLFPGQAEDIFNNTLDGISKNSGWFSIVAANTFVIVALYFAFGKFGNLRIGGAEAKPEFTKFGWYAMLLSAGMGIGLLFWSVAEPISHLSTPSPMFGLTGLDSGESAQAAMATTFFHWGVHPWAIYAIVGLGLSFFAYNRGLPLTIRSVFYPLIGNKIYGGWGKCYRHFVRDGNAYWPCDLFRARRFSGKCRTQLSI